MKLKDLPWNCYVERFINGRFVDQRILINYKNEN